MYSLYPGHARSSLPSQPIMATPRETIGGERHGLITISHAHSLPLKTILFGSSLPPLTIQGGWVSPQAGVEVGGV